MNLIQKLNRYIKLRREGFSHSTAWREFTDYPLVEADFVATALIVVVIAIIAALHWFDETKGHAEYLIRSNQYLASQYTFASADATKAWALTASLMNGAIVENGRINTYCKRKASGDCE